MNPIEKMLKNIDRLRGNEQYDEAIEGLNLVRNILDIEDNKFHNLIDSLIELCENEKNEKNRNTEPVLDMTTVFVIVNFNGLRFAILKGDRLRMKQNPKLNEWINLYKIQNNSTPRNIMMTRSDMDTDCGIFNPSTNKLRLFN